MKTIHGIVTSGKGEARAFTQLDWLRKQFCEKFGFEPYPGTLNVRIQDQSEKNGESKLPWVTIEPGQSGYCAAKGLVVDVNRRAWAVWLVPEVPQYPSDQIELVADQSLRALLRLKDGDPVEIQIRDGKV